MTVLPEDVPGDLKVALDELETAVTEMESRLESARAAVAEARGPGVGVRLTPMPRSPGLTASPPRTG